MGVSANGGTPKTPQLRFLVGDFNFFFIFTPIWGRFPFWLWRIFFKGVENHQLLVVKVEKNPPVNWHGHEISPDFQYKKNSAFFSTWTFQFWMPNASVTGCQFTLPLGSTWHPNWKVLVGTPGCTSSIGMIWVWPLGFRLGFPKM